MKIFVTLHNTMTCRLIGESLIIPQVFSLNEDSKVLSLQ